MPRYSIEIEAGDGFPDQFDVECSDDEAVQAYAIELASARLDAQNAEGPPMVVRTSLRDERGEVLAILRSRTDWPP